MEVFGPKYIGHTLDLRTIRAFILDLELNEADTLLLHPDNYDSLVLEYRDMYREPMPQPFYVLGVYIDEADANAIGPLRVPKDRVVVLYDDTRPHRVELARADTTLGDDGRTLYRCTECGGFVTPDGLPITGSLRKQYINWVKTREDPSTVRTVGECCVKG
ncbi:hypothetical protein [Hymenobacter fodinae]|uniref:Uncharacterized protein n=1 Tax=Hymenobacter fodinae TaxID=2510796 RepID=A0A4Z0PBI8_9BACT|nr:hypothetical protein [Hymenobacter fodinae]TGE08766.1 hypothetical protein EU556_13855 [Hymenobacter fodinae]